MDDNDNNSIELYIWFLKNQVSSLGSVFYTVEVPISLKMSVVKDNDSSKFSCKCILLDLAIFTP